MEDSYAVSWQSGDGRPHVGRLDVNADAITLVGAVPGERRARWSIRRDRIQFVEMTRSPRLRLNRQPTVVVGLRDGTILRVASLDGPGTVHEIARSLARPHFRQTA